MKKILILSILFSSIFSATFASTQETQRCAKKALKAYIASGAQNDYGPFTLTSGTVIPAGESFALNSLVKLIPQDEETILFQYSGSVHSGYFQDGVLVKASNCQVLSIFNIYAE